MINIYKGELFKFYKRSLFTVVASIVLLVYVISFFIRLSLIPGLSKMPPAAIKELMFSNLYFTVLETSATPLLISSFIIICSMIGSEYGANTFKTIAMRGTSKLGFINSKILAVLTFTTIFVFVGATVFTVLALFNQTKILGPGDLQIIEAPINPFFAIVTFFIFILWLLPYLGLGMFVTLLTKSSGASIALGFVYFVFVENFLQFLFAILASKYGEWLLEIPKYLLGSQLRAINDVQLFVLNSETEYLTQIYKPLLISTAYALIFYYGSIWLIKRRDILN